MPKTCTAFASLVIALVALITPASAQATKAAYLDGLGEWIDQARQDWGVPGVAVAIVDGDAVVMAEGFGVRELGRSERVDADTLFAIASQTKSFTAVLFGLLFGEGVLERTDLLVDRLPGLQFSDQTAGNGLMIMDALSHRTGIHDDGGGTLAWWGSDLSRDELVAKTRYLEFVAPVRAAHVYSNLMYVVLGQIAARAGGASWEDLISARLLGPLGMSRSRTGSIEALKLDNVATPHLEVGGKTSPIAHRNTASTAAAGGIYSSASDMARWLKMLAHEGELDGKRIISTQILSRLQHPLVMTERRQPGGSAFLAYAMGFHVREHRGELRISHGGDIDGMKSAYAVLPDRDFGVVVLSNSGVGSGFADGIVNEILDRYLGAEDEELSLLGFKGEDWSQVMRGISNFAASRRAAMGPRPANAGPPHRYVVYAGTYVNDLYGEAIVRQTAKGLTIDLTRHSELASPLEPWDGDTFRADWPGVDYADPGLVAFEVADAQAEAVTVNVSVAGNNPWSLRFRRSK